MIIKDEVAKVQINDLSMESSELRSDSGNPANAADDSTGRKGKKSKKASPIRQI